MKKSIFSTKTIVATGLGAALFMVFFMFVKVPSPVPATNIQLAYAISAFFAVVFGPICGFLVAFIGHALNDFLSMGPWWSWIIASGISGLVCGFAYYSIDLEEGKCTRNDLIKFNVCQVIGHAIAWIAVAPILDILIYKEPVNYAFTQGFAAFFMNSITTAIVGSLILIAYAKTRVGKGSLSKD